MFLYSRNEKTGKWHGTEKPLPFTTFIYLEPDFVNYKNFEQKLREIPREDYGIDIDVECIPSPVHDDKYERPGAVRLLLLAETESSLMLGADMITPDELEGNAVINCILERIFDSGRPREIRVCNDIIAHYLSGLCKMAGIKLKKVKRISVFRKYLKGLSEI